MKSTSSWTTSMGTPKDGQGEPREDNFCNKMGVFVVVVMMFGLKNMPTTLVMEIFEEFIPNFMQVFLDDFALFSTLFEHIEYFTKC